MSYTEGGHNAHNIELWQASQTLQGAHTFTEIARFRFQIKLLLASLIMRSGPGRATAMSAKGLNSPDTSSEAMPDDSSPWTIQTKTKRKFMAQLPSTCSRPRPRRRRANARANAHQTRTNLPALRRRSLYCRRRHHRLKATTSSLPSPLVLSNYS